MVTRPVVVIGVDPGDSTGIAALRDGQRWGVFQGSWMEALRQLATLLRVARDDQAVITVAVERFISSSGAPTRARSSQPTALDVIAYARQTADAYDARFVLQTPAAAKAMTTNDELRAFDLLTTPREVEQPDAKDVNDAMRHAILALASYHATLYDKLIDRTGV